MTKASGATSRTSSAVTVDTRWLLAAFAVVVGSFFLSTSYAESRLVEIDRSSAAIMRNAMPSVAHLAVLRTRLRDLEAALAQASVRGAPRAAMIERALAVEHALTALDAEAGAYGALPSWPGEAERWKRATSSLDRARVDVHAVLGALDEGDMARAHSLLSLNAQPSLSEFDGLVAELIALNATKGAREADQIEQARRRVSRIAFALDVACVVVSAAAAAMAVRAVRRSRKLIEERATELEAFASRIAHDVRGPLMPAVMALNVGMKALAPEDHRLVFLERVLRSLRVVADVVEGLFAFARAGARPEMTERASLRAAFNGVIAEVTSVAESSEAEVFVSRFVDRDVACAPGVLASLMSNLVRNSLKYMDGCPLKRVEIHAKEENDHVRVEVHDTGPGLAPGSEAVVFDPYVRGARTREAGLGLGLATVKRLAEAHGGRVGVHSIAGRGCTFWFELPIAMRPIPVQSAI
jgi:signal transduction histidine kinase